MYAGIIIASLPGILLLADLAWTVAIEQSGIGPSRHVGQKLTVDKSLRLVSLYLGPGRVMITIQAVLLLIGLAAPRIRKLTGVLALIWLLPIALLFIFKPAHNVQPKYFLFAYPLTVVVVALGLNHLIQFLRNRGMPAWACILLVLLVPAIYLAPGEHPKYMLHRTDWKDVVASVERVVEDGDCIAFAGDQKSYCMIDWYAADDFFENTPRVSLFKRGPGMPLKRTSENKRIWVLRRGDLTGRAITEDLRRRLVLIQDWEIYPERVGLYRYTNSREKQRAPR